MIRGGSPLFGAASHGQPDQAGEHEQRRDERDAEQPQRAIEDRLAIHPHFHDVGRLVLGVGDRLPLQAIGQPLLPREDVAARGGARFVAIELARVLKPDAGRQVQPEGDDLIAVPGRLPPASPGRGRLRQRLPVDDLSPSVAQLVARPRERRRLAAARGRRRRVMWMPTKRRPRRVHVLIAADAACTATRRVVRPARCS